MLLRIQLALRLVLGTVIYANDYLILRDHLFLSSDAKTGQNT